MLAVLDELINAPADKRLIEATFFRGQIALERQEFEKALADFDLVLANKMDYPVAHLHRARILLARGETEPALRSLDGFVAQGRRLATDSPELFARRGKELRALATEFLPKQRCDKIMLAHAQLQEAERRGGRSALLFDELGGTLELLGRVPEALDAYDRALKVDPKSVKMLVKRGWAWEKVRPPRYDKGRADFAAAVAIDPHNAEAHAGLGYFAASLKDSADAQRHANQAILHGAGDYLILHNVACVFATLSRHEPARAREYQDLALDLLRREVELWRKGGATGPNAQRLIAVESAFPPALKARPEFQELLRPKE